MTLVVIFAYFPLAVFQLTMLMKALLAKKKYTVAGGRRYHKLSIVITTNGQNPEVVEKILGNIRAYGLPAGLYVIREEYDKFMYSAETITVPGNYRTKNNSLKKERALQFGIEWFHYHRMVNDDHYILHLDDDSIPDKEYVQYALRMQEDAGQGEYRLRAYGKHLLSTISDFGRVTGCATMCHYFNEKGRPLGVHGEGLVIRSTVEYEIGWDYGTYGAEDYMMGQKIVRAGYRFGWIPSYIRIAPPVNAVDFYKQRRRWIYSMLWSLKEVKTINRRYVHFIYTYIIGYTGFLGGFLMVYDLLFRPTLPLWVVGIALFNLAVYFANYQYGASTVGRKYMLLAFLLQFLVAFYELGTLAYALINPPARDSFDVIKKV